MGHRTSNPTTREVGSNGGAYTWDDMQGSLSGAKLPAANDPAWTNITLDGLTTRVLAFSLNDYIDIFVQTNHSVQLNQILGNHIHWTLANDDDGDEIRFTLSGVGAAAGIAFADITPLDSGDIVLAGNAGKHNYLSLGDINAMNSTTSTIYVLRLTRVAVVDGNDSAELVYVFFNDSHVKVDTIGSLNENAKI